RALAPAEQLGEAVEGHRQDQKAVQHEAGGLQMASPRVDQAGSQQPQVDRQITFAERHLPALARATREAERVYSQIGKLLLGIDRLRTEQEKTPECPLVTRDVVGGVQ